MIIILKYYIVLNFCMLVEIRFFALFFSNKSDEQRKKER